MTLSSKAGSTSTRGNVSPENNDQKAIDSVKAANKDTTNLLSPEAKNVPKRKWSRINTKDLAPGALKANGAPNGDLNRTDSLNIPGGVGTKGSSGNDDGRDSPRSDKSSDSRRGSTRSIDSRMSAIDMSKVPTTQLLPKDTDEEEEKPKSAGVADGSIKSAIPVMPMWLAVTCAILNVLIPGFGTILSGFTLFCCARPRVVTKEESVTDSVCLNVWVGFAQLCTVTFMLVGWFWSFVWGIYMIILAVEAKREEKAKHEKEMQVLALTAFSPQVRPWQLK